MTQHWHKDASPLAHFSESKTLFIHNLHGLGSRIYMMTTKKTHDASLDGLLVGLGGVEGSVLSRPKSLHTMKKDTKGTESVSTNHSVVEHVESPAKEDVHHLDVEQLLGATEVPSSNQFEEIDIYGGGQEYSSNGGFEDDPFFPTQTHVVEEKPLHQEEEDPMEFFGGGEKKEETLPTDNVVLLKESSTTNAKSSDDTETVHSRGNSLPVFDYLDKRSSAMPQHSVSAPHDTATEVHAPVVGVLQPETSEQHTNHHHHHAGEAMAEIGHKAAKALQLGKKWLFNTSKNIARDVQSRMDARASRKKHSRQTSIIDSPMSDFVPEEHHRLWAEQLVRVPSETRMAALDAMEEYDKLAVQSVIDDLMWQKGHEASLETYNDELEHQQTNHSPPPSPPPPSYDDVVVASSAAPPAAGLEDTFDLLDLDGTQQQPVDSSASYKNANSDSTWEGNLFGSNIRNDAEKSAVAGVAEQSDEPEIRKKLRDERIAREKQRIEEQVASVRDKEARDMSEKEEKIALREKLRPEIDAWCAGKKDNIRSLLCTMDKVMWKDSTWKSPSVVDVMEPAKVRRWYMKANLVIHPDKVKQNHGSLEQLTRAEMIFDTLQHAWALFQN